MLNWDIKTIYDEVTAEVKDDSDGTDALNYQCYLTALKAIEALRCCLQDCDVTWNTIT